MQYTCFRITCHFKGRVLSSCWVKGLISWVFFYWVAGFYAVSCGMPYRMGMEANTLKACIPPVLVWLSTQTSSHTTLASEGTVCWCWALYQIHWSLQKQLPTELWPGDGVCGDGGCVVACTWNPRNEEAEAGGFQIEVYPGLQNEFKTNSINCLKTNQLVMRCKIYCSPEVCCGLFRPPGIPQVGQATRAYENWDSPSH